jgi:hypothetical protein
MSSQNMVALPPYTFRIRLAQFIIAFLVLILDVSSSFLSDNDGDDTVFIVMIMPLPPTKDLCPLWVSTRREESLAENRGSSHGEDAKLPAFLSSH